jgi:hypothetical protein
MTNIKNSKLIETILETLIKKIGRRTSEAFAVVTIATVIKSLVNKYVFLKYINIKDTSYSEGIRAITIHPKIDTINPNVFQNALKEIIEKTVSQLNKKADYFFIKEFHEAFADILNFDLNDLNLNLNLMQFQYIVDRKHDHEAIKNSEVIENILIALTILINKKLSETLAIRTMVSTVNKLKEKYSLFNHVEISETSDSKGYYSINTLPGIDDIDYIQISQAIEAIIEEIGILIECENDEQFIINLKDELGERHLSAMKKMGINLDHIQNRLFKCGHELLIKRVISVLIEMIGRETSVGFAVSALDKIINNLQEKYEILKYIKIDENNYDKGPEAFYIEPEINSVESFKIGKAIREIIKTIYNSLGAKTYNFIDEFKNKLGERYLSEIEKLGVNLHFLELKLV